MIKECPVILNNDAVTVVRFDGIDIQFPCIGKNIKTLNVKFENGKYTIVNNNEIKQDYDIKKPIKIKAVRKNKKAIKNESDDK